MKLILISVPYDSGIRGVRMGAGPGHLIAEGLPNLLDDAGHQVRIEVLEHGSEPPTEIRTGFELMGKVALHVRDASEKGDFPIVLSGNCNVAIGTIAGLHDETGVLWLDAHPDFQTPHTTTSGFLDATGLATATGHCWGGLAATVPGFHPVPEAHVVLAGVRDFRPEEHDALNASKIAVLPPQASRNPSTLSNALDDLAGCVEGVYLHIDLDVLDPSYGIANQYAAPAGLSPSEVIAIVEEVSRRLPVRAIGVASFDPTLAPHGGVTRTATRVLVRIVALATASAV